MDYISEHAVIEQVLKQEDLNPSLNCSDDVQVSTENTSLGNFHVLNDMINKTGQDDKRNVDVYGEKIISEEYEVAISTMKQKICGSDKQNDITLYPSLVSKELLFNNIKLNLLCHNIAFII